MTESIKQHSIGKRYLFKLLSNGSSIPLFFILESLLPRSLGPELYGVYSYATLFCFQFVTFVDLGTSTCFTTKLSQHPNNFSLVSFYSRLICCVFIITLLFSLLLLVPSFIDNVLPNIPLWVAYPAVFWGLLSWLGKVMRGVNDALGLTVYSEIVRISVNLIAALTLFVLYYFDLLNIITIFLQQYTYFIALILSFIFTLRNVWKVRRWKISLIEAKSYTKEFLKFCLPLALMLTVASFDLIGGRWFLQYFAGNIEQGYFSLGQKASAACLLFITAIYPLIARDLAVAYGSLDLIKMRSLVERFGPLLYTIAAYFACFSSIESTSVVGLFGGQSFSDAVLPVKVMVLFALPQTYSHVCGAIYYASGQTLRLCKLGIGTTILGLICVFFLVAPINFGGLNLGALGLSIKMVCVQFVAVNIFLFAAKNIVNFSFKHCFFHQIYCPICFLIMALGSKYIVQASMADFGYIIKFFISGAIYTMLCGVAMFYIPQIFGGSKKDIDYLFNTIKLKFR